ncbi:hypothetical protein HX017_14985 [Myroides marinus]|jgi:hypothetical protein|uniref:DUF6095 family protein n=1 Tax=Myroides marinus TaxID=703342 RepID=UPI0025773B85|nr:DUF6095 family protein [Myroides marinus]MDR0195672.1 DUF6095 family protein [Myroides sp.]MDM1348392.1 hypothetical protein [Myroides marinus]MDM1351926.1 hypothetical protein [Myroides marinus]MDM1353555.1 hypothetical protein [Myroides marinus]MDM1359111.1 hypothetical protein [Myroides marinus]
MEQEPQIDRKLLNKGVKYLMITLPLMFLGPIVIHSSLKNQGHPFFYPIFGLGCLICLTSMLLFFKGLQTIIKSLFGK